MPLYLVDYVRRGRVAGRTQLWPRGSEQPGWSAIKLGPGGAQSTRALLWLPLPDLSLGARKLAEDKAEPLAHASRTRLYRDLRTTRAEAMTPRQMVASLCLTPPARRWKPIRPAGNRYEVWLGGERWVDQPVLSGGATYTSTFTSDENPLSESGTWEVGVGLFAAVKKASGRARVAAIGIVPCSARYTGAVGANHYSQAEAYRSAATVSMVGTCVRMTASDEPMYATRFWLNDGWGFTLEEFDGSGMETVLAGPSSPTFGAGQIIRLTAVGSTLTSYYNGVQQQIATDATLTTGSVGFMVFSESADTNAELDNWQGGDQRVWLLTLLGTGGAGIATGETEPEPGEDPGTHITTADNIDTAIAALDSGSHMTLCLHGGVYTQTIDGDRAGLTLRSHAGEDVTIRGTSAAERGMFLITAAAVTVTGTAGHPIVFDAVNMSHTNGFAVQQSSGGTNTVLSYVSGMNSNSSGLQQNNGGSGITLTNTEWSNNGTDALDHGIYLKTGTIVINSMICNDNTGFGLHLYGGSMTCTINDVTCTGNNKSGMNAGDMVSGSTVTNITCSSNTENGIFHHGSDGVTFTDVVTSNNGGYGLQNLSATNATVDCHTGSGNGIALRTGSWTVIGC